MREIIVYFELHVSNSNTCSLIARHSNISAQVIRCIFTAHVIPLLTLTSFGFIAHVIATGLVCLGNNAFFAIIMVFNANALIFSVFSPRVNRVLTEKLIGGVVYTQEQP